MHQRSDEQVKGENHGIMASIGRNALA